MLLLYIIFTFLKNAGNDSFYFLSIPRIIYIGGWAEKAASAISLISADLESKGAFDVFKLSSCCFGVIIAID